MPKQFRQVITVACPVRVAGTKCPGEVHKSKCVALASELPQLITNCRLVLFITNGYKYTALFQKEPSQLFVKL